MLELISQYKLKLKEEMTKYMALPVSERTWTAISNMAECWESLVDLEKDIRASKCLSDADMAEWKAMLQNADGSEGAYWTVEQTSIYKPAGLEMDSSIWNMAMNMIYSDYGAAAAKYGVNVPEFFADMTCAFLCDKDGPSPSDKLSRYYHSVVKRD